MIVLDASALSAYLFRETGCETVERHLVYLIPFLPHI
jgi:PIN domain nuclease of toxin-antitoxin system